FRPLRRFLSSPGLVACRGAQKPMTPTKRRRRMDSAERRGLRQALALDHRARVIEPAVLLAQMRHRRPGQRIEGAPAALAAKPQKPMRAAPADDFAARAMGTPLSRHALDAGRSERVLLAAALAALLGGSCSRAPNHARLLKRNHRLPALVLAHPRNRRQPSRKIFNLHRIALPIRTTLTKSTTNAIRADKLFPKFRICAICLLSRRPAPASCSLRGDRMKSPIDVFHETGKWKKKILFGFAVTH